MTTIPGTRSATEQELTERLRRLAAGFIAELDTQGRLVESGGAQALEHLRAEVEARRCHPLTYRTAVDTIVSDCSYPRAVALQIADVLHRKGLLAEDEAPQPRPEHEPEPARASIPRPATLEPASAGARVVHRVTTPSAVSERERSPEPPAEVPSDLQAEWSEEHARAATVAAKLRSDHATRAELSGVAAEGERVTVAIKAASLDDWGYWLTAIGAPLAAASHQAGYAQLAVGAVEGVEVHLTAHDVPRLLSEAADAVADPFVLWGRLYDLTRAQRDRFDNVWAHLGRRQESGMPLLCLHGTDGPQYPLGSIVLSNGPLVAVESANPTAPPAAGGT